ncbi:MAG: DnaJ domain-containing protein [Nitrosopumilus sp.]
MNNLSILIISVVIIGTFQVTYAQSEKLDMELEVSDEEKIILFGGFTIGIIAIFLFLARDIILRRKTSYDKEEFESKKEKTYEKYHSDWGDDYEELGTRKNTKEDKEFRDAATKNELPDYYKILGVSRNATPEEIKKEFRKLVKKTHPDKTRKDSEDEMTELNIAYEVLSDKERREKYDRYLKTD